MSTTRWTPTEDDEQMALFRWAAYNAGKYPQLANMYHVPNGGGRSKAEAGRLKAMGVKRGVPDICLDWPAGGFHGLRIELKRLKRGRPSPEQLEWGERLTRAGYCWRICRGWGEAAALIEDYLSGRVTP